MARRAIAEGHILMLEGWRPAGEMHVTINGLDLGAITGRMSAEDSASCGQGRLTCRCSPPLRLDIIRLWGFVTFFFYCLGAMYDERKDRSVLFWKSLPLSDSETVLSKVASALVVAPCHLTAVACGSAHVCPSSH